MAHAKTKTALSTEEWDKIEESAERIQKSIVGTVSCVCKRGYMRVRVVYARMRVASLSFSLSLFLSLSLSFALSVMCGYMCVYLFECQHACERIYICVRMFTHICVKRGNL